MIKKSTEGPVSVYVADDLKEALQLSFDAYKICVSWADMNEAAVAVVGADDDKPALPAQDIFISPFRLGELLDRIAMHQHGKITRAPEGTIKLAGYLFSPARGVLEDEGGADISLTEKERDILLALFDADGKTVARQALLEEVWGYAEGLETHTLETHIYRLRQKIEKDPSNPALLKTEEDGYRIELA